MTEEEFEEAQIGTHSVDTTPVNLGEGSEHIPFEIETEAVFKRLARDIYETDAAGVREPLTNAVTAILRAVEHGSLEKDEGVVTVTVKQDGSRSRLILRDNGIGMTKSKIRKIVAVIGASESRDIGELAGQFGMGFLAVFRLVGIDGGFEMSTNPRYSDEGPISGLWKSGGFSVDDEQMLSEGLDEDEYGTRFEFILKDGISRQDVRNWVAEYAEWARVPVVYEEEVDGRSVFEEDYGGFDKNFRTVYSEDEPFVEYEDEYIYASSSPDADGRTILLDVPVKRRDGDISTILGSVDVRLKNENGIVVEGPHEGSMVVSDGEYDNMDETRRESFIPEREVTTDDIVMPKPTGTRRVLSKNRQFWNWVDDKLQSRLTQKLKGVMEDVNNFDDLMSLEKSRFKMVLEGASNQVRRRYNSGYDPSKDGGSIKNWFDKNHDITISTELAKQMGALVYKVRYADEDVSNIKKKRNLGRRAPAMAVYDAYHNDGRIFMGCRLSRDKAEVIWEDNDSNYLFKVESTDDYEVYEELLGWEQLKSVSESNIDEFDISDETKKNLIGETATKASESSSEYELKFHFRGSRKYTKDITVSKLEEMLEEADDDELISLGHREVDNFILFPTHKDRNISSSYWASDSQNPMSRCRKKDWERLKHFDRVTTLDQLVEQSRNVSFSTAHGEYNLSSFDDEFDDETQVIFHLLEEPFKSRMENTEYMSRAEEYVNEKFFGDRLNLVYAPVTEETLRELHPAISNHQALFGDFSSSTLANTNTLRNDTRIYSWLRLYDWTDTKEYDVIQNDLSRTQIQNGGYEIVETLRRGLESEGAFSEDGDISEQV